MPPTKLSLPGNILKEIGISSDTGLRDAKASPNRWKSQGQNRKDRRKAERSLKRRKASSSQAPISSTKAAAGFGDYPDVGRGRGKGPMPGPSENPAPTELRNVDDSNRKRKRNECDTRKAGEEPKHKKTSEVVSERLAKDDAEIVALEKKLGIKGRKRLPKSFYDDGLGNLLGEGDTDDSLNDSPHLKAEMDDWLASKRRTARKQHTHLSDGSDDDGGGLDGFDQSDYDSSDDEDNILGSPYDGKDPTKYSDTDSEADANYDSDVAPSKRANQPKARENPYVAPLPASASGHKYIPPSLRKPLGKDADMEAQIRKRMQGPVNRVTEANLISIVAEIERLYREYPRGIVTDILTDLLMAQVCDQTSKPDTLLVLSAGFIAALYKVVGVDFAARLLQAVVERFQQEYEAALKATTAGQTPTKETSNLITLLSEMYMFRVVGSNLVFDYVKLLLRELSELNAELLLRIVRMAGPQLRKDDPLALKDIVGLVRPAVAEAGESNLTVRTKFMIETISDLKNNKVKAGSQDLIVLHEHVTRMRKVLGAMETSKVKATEPLRIGLQDIQNADKTGKWWLVGASWGGRQDDKLSAASKPPTENPGSSGIEGGDEVVPADELDMPDYAELAREQGMNTDVRRAVFIALVAAADYQDAYLRILKLRLNKHNRREIANVLVQCSSAQQHYNPYYTLVANRFCGDSRIRYAFQDVLWTLFRRLGEPLFGEEAEVEDEDAAENRRLINAAKMFGHLIVDSCASIVVLKPLNLAYIKETTSLFVEVLLITVMQECSRKKGTTVEDALAKVFTANVPTELARGLRYFIRKKVRVSDLVNGGREAKKVREACKVAERLLEQL